MQQGAVCDRHPPLYQTPTAPRTARFARFTALLHDTRRRQRLLFFGSLIAFSIVAVLATLVRLYQFLPFDLPATLELQEHENRILYRLMYLISIFGYTPWVLPTLAGGAALVAWRVGLRDAGYLLLITVLQGLANAAIKVAIGRPRPVSDLVDVLVPERGNSFPSGHVMFYTVFFGFLAFLAWTRIKTPALRWTALLFTLGLIALIGPSRMFLGAHWLSDVIAAYLLGLIILAFAIEGYLAYLKPGYRV